jgi:hypothetical protein
MYLALSWIPIALLTLSQPTVQVNPRLTAGPETIEEFWLSPMNEPLRSGGRGIESDWLLVSRMDLHSGKVWIGPEGAPIRSENGLELDVPNGQMIIEARMMVYGNRKFISRSRIKREDAFVGVSTVAGEVDVPNGWVTIAVPFGWLNADSFREATKTAIEQTNKPFASVLDTSQPNRHLILLRTGFGPGKYKVYRLRSSLGWAGYEMEFIAPNAPMPPVTPATDR